MAHTHLSRPLSALVLGSVDTLRARQSWFTPELYRLMEDDLGASGSAPTRDA